MLKLKAEVLDRFMLRRTKANKSDDLMLPPRLVSIKFVKLHPVEEDFYQAIYTKGRSMFDDYVTDGTLLNNYAHVFDLLMRMRQAVDHPYLVLYNKKSEDERKARGEVGRAEEVAIAAAECAICGETPTKRIQAECCRGFFCRGCVVDFFATAAGVAAGKKKKKKSVLRLRKT